MQMCWEGGVGRWTMGWVANGALRATACVGQGVETMSSLTGRGGHQNPSESSWNPSSGMMAAADCSRPTF